jgi:hypothetical protein
MGAPPSQLIGSSGVGRAPRHRISRKKLHRQTEGLLLQDRNGALQCIDGLGVILQTLQAQEVGNRLSGNSSGFVDLMT